MEMSMHQQLFRGSNHTFLGSYTSTGGANLEQVMSRHRKCSFFIIIKKIIFASERRFRVINLKWSSRWVRW